MNRRTFINVVSSGFTFALIAPTLKVKTDEPTKYNQPTEILTGLKDNHKPPTLWNEGWHTVKIHDVYMKPSRLDGTKNIVFELESLDGQSKLYNYFSEKAPAFIIPFIAKAGINVTTATESVDLTNTIGKEIQIEIKHEQFMNRTMNRIVK